MIPIKDKYNDEALLLSMKFCKIEDKRYTNWN